MSNLTITRTVGEIRPGLRPGQLLIGDDAEAFAQYVEQALKRGTTVCVESMLQVRFNAGAHGARKAHVPAGTTVERELRHDNTRRVVVKLAGGCETFYVEREYKGKNIIFRLVMGDAMRNMEIEER